MHGIAFCPSARCPASAPHTPASLSWRPPTDGGARWAGGVPPHTPARPDAKCARPAEAVTAPADAARSPRERRRDPDTLQARCPETRPQGRLSSGCALALRPAPSHHRHAQTLERRAGLGQGGPALGARGGLAPAPRGHVHPQDACGRLAGPVVIPLALAARGGVARIAAAAQACGVRPCSRLLSHTRRRTRHERTPSLLPVIGLGVALQAGRPLLGLQGTWRSRLWPRGGRLLHRRVRLFTRGSLSRRRASRPRTFPGIIGHDLFRALSPSLGCPVNIQPFAPLWS
jgi:hypothetical protein